MGEGGRTKITFHGGVNDIGGNQFLVESGNTRVFMDFGMSFRAEQKFFSEFLKARTSNSLVDMLELGLLPRIKGLYRRDFAEHMGYGGDEPTSVDAVLLTHAHVDHCGYIRYLREDIPIYCSEESRLIMQNFDETGVDEQYLTAKEKFRTYTNKKGGLSRKTGEDTHVKRAIETFESGKSFNIDSIEVEPLPVDHSIPGVHAFILHTRDGSIGNTADLRFHGRRKDDTEKFVKRCAESGLDVLLCEGTRVDAEKTMTEYDVETGISDIVNNTTGLVVCGYPVRDLDRLLSFYVAAKNTNRDLVLDMKQAYLLKLFSESTALKDNPYPSLTDPNIKIYIQRSSWGLIDKVPDRFPAEMLPQDYRGWQREFLDHPGRVDYRDIRKDQSQYIFFCSDFRLQDLIDIRPEQGCTYIRSLTEPFNTEMEIKEAQVRNWMEEFKLVTKDEKWHKIHISGHGDGRQIEHVVRDSKAGMIIPIHTERPEYHKKWHQNVTEVAQHGTYGL